MRDKNKSDIKQADKAEKATSHFAQLDAKTEQINKTSAMPGSCNNPTTTAQATPPIEVK